MIQSTVDNTVFVETTPDWSKPVVVTTTWKTGIKQNREGGEQRTCGRNAPRLTIRFQDSSITPKAQALRRAEAMTRRTTLTFLLVHGR